MPSLADILHVLGYPKHMVDEASTYYSNKMMGDPYPLGGPTHTTGETLADAIIPEDKSGDYPSQVQNQILRGTAKAIGNIPTDPLMALGSIKGLAPLMGIGGAVGIGQGAAQFENARQEDKLGDPETIGNLTETGLYAVPMLAGMRGTSEKGAVGPNINPPESNPGFFTNMINQGRFSEVERLINDPVIKRELGPENWGDIRRRIEAGRNPPPEVSPERNDPNMDFLHDEADQLEQDRAFKSSNNAAAGRVFNPDRIGRVLEIKNRQGVDTNKAFELDDIEQNIDEAGLNRAERLAKIKEHDPEHIGVDTAIGVDNRLQELHSEANKMNHPEVDEAANRIDPRNRDIRNLPSDRVNEVNKLLQQDPNLSLQTALEIESFEHRAKEVGPVNALLGDIFGNPTGNPRPNIEILNDLEGIGEPVAGQYQGLVDKLRKYGLSNLKEGKQILENIKEGRDLYHGEKVDPTDSPYYMYKLRNILTDAYIRNRMHGGVGYKHPMDVWKDIPELNDTLVKLVREGYSLPEKIKLPQGEAAGINVRAYQGTDPSGRNIVYKLSTAPASETEWVGNPDVENLFAPIYRTEQAGPIRLDIVPKLEHHQDFAGHRDLRTALIRGGYDPVDLHEHNSMRDPNTGRVVVSDYGSVIPKSLNNRRIDLFNKAGLGRLTPEEKLEFIKLNNRVLRMGIPATMMMKAYGQKDDQ